MVALKPTFTVAWRRAVDEWNPAGADINDRKFYGSSIPTFSLPDCDHCWQSGKGPRQSFDSAR